MSENELKTVSTGVAISIFAIGVLFAQTTVPALLAGQLGGTIVETAIGWLIFGLTVAIVGYVRAR